ncbi:MAG: major membrane immunogen (membrane-anchored lipoprotein) [Clostridium sp.]|jgi:major membrane immunogen (membrane-anchored lipoprotein)
MKNKKIISIIAASVITLSVLSGCGKAAETAAPAPEAPVATQAPEAPVAETKTPEVYTATAPDFDERGWKGEVTVTYTDGKISKVEYVEVKKDGTKKSEDKSYEAMKVSPGEAYTQLTEAALKDDKAITVSGATEISNTFKTLYAEAKSMKK